MHMALSATLYLALALSFIFASLPTAAATVTCDFTYSALYPTRDGTSGGTLFNDSASAFNGVTLCQTVRPGSINFTYGAVINQLTVSYFPLRSTTAHGTEVGSKYTYTLFEAGEVITAVTLYYGTYIKGDPVVAGIFLVTNTSSTYPIGSLTGDAYAVALPANSYVAAFWGFSGNVINNIGFLTRPLSGQ